MPRDFTDIAAPSAAATLDSALQYGAALQRNSRRHDYTLFKRLAEAFYEAPPLDPNHIRMKSRHGFYIALGAPKRDYETEASSAGATPVLRPAALDGDNRGRTVEIFYGKRPVRNFHKLNNERMQGEWRDVRETGAAMLYSQGDDGVVSVFLYPCFTDNLAPSEDAILLGRYADLAPLTGRGALERHWSAFRAYAEVTSIDGEPTLFDRAQVAWMRFSRPLARDGRLLRREAEGALRSGFGFLGAAAAGAWLLTAVGG